MPKLYLFILAIILSSCATQQQSARYPDDLNKKYLKKYNQAKQAQRQGNTKEAIKIYEELLQQNPDLIAAKINLARLAYDQGDKAKAKVLFSDIATNHPDYDPKTYLAYGSLLMELEEYEEAAHMYQQYLTQDPDHKGAMEAFTKASTIAAATANPVSFTPTPLSPLVNTTDLEYEASFTADETTMIFTRLLNNQEDFYQASLVNGVITEVQAITELNTADNEGAHSISADGKELIFTFCDNRKTIGGCDLYSSSFVDGIWMRPINLGRQLNSESNDSQPSLSGDGQTLYFRSSREGGFGNFDIWSATKSTEGIWSNVQNLGEYINTAGNDETPFLHKDGLTLYFSSDGRDGLGDLDLYLARRDQWDAEWSSIEHMPYPINTPYEDSGLKVSLDGKIAYFATDRNEGNLRDLYSFALPESLRPHESSYIKVLVVDASTQQPVMASLKLTALQGNAQQLTAQADNNGEVLMSFPTDQAMSIHIIHPDYLFFSDHIEPLDNTSKTEPLVYKVDLEKATKKSEIEENKPIVLQNIFFETGSAVLDPRSQVEIDLLHTLLNDFSTMTIMIIGHTDNVGNEQDNILLSQQRALAVRQALIDKGIAAIRLSHTGKGESEPIAGNDSEQGRQANRRTEFTVIKN